MERKTSLKILLFLGAIHFINDAFQSIIAATYPILKDELSLNFAKIGLITFAYQISASLLQPFFGLFFDIKQSPWSLLFAILFTSIGIVFLATLHTFVGILCSVILFGIGSSIFHPEGSRLAHKASNGKRGLAQAIFQVGGNAGGAIGPLFIAFLVSTYGRIDILYCLIMSFIAFYMILYLKRKYQSIESSTKKIEKKQVDIQNPFSPKKTFWIMGILLILIFSKFVYMESIRSYYTFYLINKFGISVSASQVSLFLFLFATAIGTCIGGPIGDKVGRKYIIWASILGTAPFAMMMPYANLTCSLILSFLSGLILSSAFPAIVVYAQELVPKKLGLISGLFFGVAFGVAGIVSALLGYFIDIYGLDAIYKFCSFMPLLGLVAYFLPNIKESK